MLYYLLIVNVAYRISHKDHIIRNGKRIPKEPETLKGEYWLSFGHTRYRASIISPVSENSDRQHNEGGTTRIGIEGDFRST